MERKGNKIFLNSKIRIVQVWVTTLQPFSLRKTNVNDDVAMSFIMKENSYFKYVLTSTLFMYIHI